MFKPTIENIASGSYIFMENREPQDYFYIIQSGTVVCSHKHSEKKVTYGAGNIIGVVSCMTGRTQTESVLAVSPVTAVKVMRSQYVDLIKGNTAVAMKIVQMLSRDLRIFNETYEKRTGHTNTLSRTEHIYDTAVYYENSSMPDLAAFTYYQYLKESLNGINREAAQKAYDKLKTKVHVVYLEPTDEMARAYPEGSMIFTEGQTGREMFIVQKGSVRISKIVNEEEQIIAFFKPGDVLGEMALLENDYRSANAIANEDCVLLVLNRENFDQMVQTQPQYIYKLTTTLANRHWYSYRRLSNLRFSDVRARLIDMIATQLEMSRVNKDEMELQYETNLSPLDLVNMCGYNAEEQGNITNVLTTTQHIRIHNGKIVISDCEELIKQAEFNRKKIDKK